jgi:hypothetical protein
LERNEVEVCQIEVFGFLKAEARSHTYNKVVVFGTSEIGR